jgi:CHAD domain-containing protein
VLAKTLENLHRRSSSQTTHAALTKLEKVVLGRLQQSLESGNGCRDLKPVLESARCRAGNWPLGKLKWGDVCGGLRQGYRRARKALKVAENTRADEDLHQWRKRVKDMWYQLGLVQSVCPKAVARLADKMKVLSEYLGDDHDLMMLAAAAKNAGLGSEEAQSVLAWIQGQRHRLQTSAFHLGQKLFAEKPGQFAGRVADYWKGKPGS